MLKAAKWLLIAASILVLAVIGYGGWSFLNALADADQLSERANRLIANGRSGSALGEGRLDALLKIEDPGFASHSGVDLVTAGAGATTISQSLSKRLAFDEFRPGIGKIRQTGYALGLEQRLSKEQILALWLDTLEMGRGSSGWITGFFEASEQIYGRPPAGLTDEQFLRLVAVLIAPASFNLMTQDASLDERVNRIKRLLSGTCHPLSNNDVWLEGCSQEP